MEAARKLKDNHSYEELCAGVNVDKDKSPTDKSPTRDSSESKENRRHSAPSDSADDRPSPFRDVITSSSMQGSAGALADVGTAFRSADSSAFVALRDASSGYLPPRMQPQQAPPRTGRSTATDLSLGLLCGSAVDCRFMF